MTKSETAYLASKLPYGDGSNKIFGMENFGNTCYCNSILQCLYFTEKFRIELLSHHVTDHDRKLNLYGIKSHSFTNKYEALVNKRTKDQQKAVADEKPKSRKGSLFGIKFNSNNNNGQMVYNENDIPNKKAYIFEAQNCEFLSMEQKVRINKDRDFKNIQFMITRPSQSQEISSSNNNDYSQSSSMLLTGDNNNNNNNNTNGGSVSSASGVPNGNGGTTGSTTSTHNGSIGGNSTNGSINGNDDGVISSQSSFIIVGIPYPETFLQNPINPFNASPTSDQRKKLALINGPIVNLDHSLQLPSEQSDDSALLYALKDLFECMVENRSNIGVVSPNYFITKLKEKNFLFRQNNMHHDAHEFCNYLINEIIECLNQEVGIENNWCNKLFQGSITNETKCLSCETITSKDEAFLDLSIDIPPNNSPHSLTHSLNNFSRSEILTHQNKFYCNSCSSLQEATKTIKIKLLPEILVINFKRFKYDENLDKMVKLFNSISYPFKLRLFNTTIPDKRQKDDDTTEFNNFNLYELYALVVHIGGGPMHGHYISLCKIKSQIWLLFDDETVEIVDDSYVMRFFGDGPGLSSAYILFYRVCDTLDEGEEELLDFGFNANDLYNGNDYNMAFNNNADTSTIGSSIRKPSSVSSSKLNYNQINEEPHHQRDKSQASSIGGKDGTNVSTASDTIPNNSPSLIPIKKSGLFKKNFRLDGSTADSSINETENGESEHEKPKVLEPEKNKDQYKDKEDKSKDKDKEKESSKEKKTWVGGLKKREPKPDSSSNDRKVSSSSTKLEDKEKRKSFFGFKRK